jgi:cytochrome c oxidase subunit IV
MVAQAAGALEQRDPKLIMRHTHLQVDQEVMDFHILLQVFLHIMLEEEAVVYMVLIQDLLVLVD